jgi:hypothetical protein
VYFADAFSKSVTYCRDFQTSFGNVGGQLGQQNQYGYNSRNNAAQAESRSKCLLLCEVALGGSFLAHTTEFMECAKPGTHSTKAIGLNAPDATKSITTPDGMVIPNGAVKPVPVPQEWKPQPPPAPQQYHCTSQNEFIMSVCQHSGTSARRAVCVALAQPLILLFLMCRSSVVCLSATTRANVVCVTWFRSVRHDRRI